MPNSGEAFRARAELIRNAQSSLDLQYYIVHDGLSTRMLVDELLKAADRGMELGAIRLLEKKGGKSGHWRAGAEGKPASAAPPEVR